MRNKIVFVSDTFHHHQRGVADALYELTNGAYCFITIKPLREERLKMGFANEYPNYVLDTSSKTDEIMTKAQHIIDEAEVVVLGSAPFSFLKQRLSDKKLTFRYSERLWKQYKHYVKTPIYMFDNYRTRGCYLLCSSAFASHDYNAMGAFKGRCYKWGYFTAVPQEKVLNKTKDVSTIHIMWCSRFLDWKHPELPIYLAKNLKERGHRFCIDMFGSGQYLNASKVLASKLNVSDIVHFTGNTSNAKILEAMGQCDIFLFTSDRREGWGVVANEAMSNGCVLVANNEIGSVPYLVNDGENGYTFHSSSRCYGFNRFGVSVDTKALNSLTEKVEWLFSHPNNRVEIAQNAYNTMNTTWNPRQAATNLLTLIEDIRQGRETSIAYGPCSKA